MAQNIDTYFKQKLEHRTFELKDAYWQEAAALLDAEDKKKKRAFVFWWTGGLLGMALLAFVLFNKNNMANNSVKAQQVFIENKTDANTQKENIVASEESEKELINPVEKNNKNNSLTNKGISTIKKENNNPSNLIAVNIPENKNELIAIENPANNKSTLIIDKKSAPDNLDHLLIFVNGEKENEEKLDLKDVNGCFQPSPWHIGVTAAQLMQAYPKSGENLITGFYAGVVGQYDLNKNWFVSAGLGYTRRGGHYEAAKMTETRMYRFGLELMEDQLRPSSLHYATATLSAGWKKGHHLFEGGLILDYLAGVRGEKGKLEKTDAEEPIKDFVPYQKGWIDEEGITPFNVSPMVGYRYRVNKELSFGMAVQYAVRPLTNKAPEMGEYILKENDRFNLRLNAVYLIK